MVHDVVDDGGLQVQGLFEERRPVRPGRPVVGRGRDARRRVVARFKAPEGVLLQVPDRYRGERHAEELGRKRPDVALGNPRGTEVRVDFAGEHVLGLHGPEGLGVPLELGPGRFGDLQLLPDVPREVVVGRLPASGRRFSVNQVSQLLHDAGLVGPVERGDEA